MTTVSTFQLESQRGKDAPDTLHAFLRKQRGSDVAISLHQMNTLSGPQIELLLSGYQQWQLDGHRLVLAGANPALMSRLTHFGMPVQMFSKEAE